MNWQDTATRIVLAGFIKDYHSRYFDAGLVLQMKEAFSIIGSQLDD